MNRRHLLLAIGLALSLIVVNLGIARREAVLRDGVTVLLELAPVDPRSLMQGDYMALDFALAAQVLAMIDLPTRDRGYGDGYAVLARSADGTAQLVRIDPDPSTNTSGEVALRYRLRGGSVRIVTNAWFFPEGQGDRYVPARYGELRLGDDGEALLVAMRDAELKPL